MLLASCVNRFAGSARRDELIMPQNIEIPQSNIDNRALYRGGDALIKGDWVKGLEITLVKCETAVDSDPIYKVDPSISNYFPSKMYKAAINGEATVQLIISKEGKVIHYNIIRDTHREFRNATIALIPALNFIPAKKDNQVIECLVEAKIEFKLTEEYDDN